MNDTPHDPDHDEFDDLNGIDPADEADAEAGRRRSVTQLSELQAQLTELQAQTPRTLSGGSPRLSPGGSPRGSPRSGRPGMSMKQQWTIPD